MSNLATRLATAKRTISNMRQEHKSMESQTLQHVVAMGGGVAGALARRYLPGIVPGSAGDSPALLATVLLVDGLAAYSGSPEMLAFSFAYEGKVVGDAFESAMDWRPSPAVP